MNLIDDVLDAIADPDTGLWNALDATYTAAHKLELARARRNGTFGAEQVLQRAQNKMESVKLLTSALDEPFRSLFPVLMQCFHKLDAYRAAAADESQDRYAADHLDYVEDAAREALAEFVLGEPVSAVAA